MTFTQKEIYDLPYVFKEDIHAITSNKLMATFNKERV